MLGDTVISRINFTVISSINFIIAPWWIILKKWKLQQVVVYSLAIIVWVNNFQTPKIQAVLSSFFRDSNDSAGGSNRGGGWVEEGESHDHLMAPKCHSRLTQGLRKAATETKLVALEQGQQWNMIVHWASYLFLVKT